MTGPRDEYDQWADAWQREQDRAEDEEAERERTSPSEPETAAESGPKTP